jgi:hypothetical protein
MMGTTPMVAVADASELNGIRSVPRGLIESNSGGSCGMTAMFAGVGIALTQKN